MKSKLSHRTIALALSVIGCGPVSAGDLTPPIGPVVPTLKTLVEVEPRIAVNSLPGSATAIHRITAPGSYYLTANITGETGKNGIEVFIPTGIERGVTIDLNGFAMAGVPGSLEGIQTNFSATILNGGVSGWGGDGVSISQGIVRDLRVRSNGGSGIRGSWSVSIQNCTLENNAGDGITAGDNINVFDCLSKGNTGRGIHVDGVCIIRDCVAYANGAGGISAFGLGHVTRCTLFSNMGPSIEVNGFARVTENQVFGGTVGILANLNGSRIEDNLLSFSGIKVMGTKNLVVRNSLQDLGTAMAFDIGPGNMVGPVTTDPATAGEWANFVMP